MDTPITSLPLATSIIRRCGMAASATRVRPMHGGMVSMVEEWLTDNPPYSLVCKRSSDPQDTGLRHEMDSLQWFRAHSELPVPEVYGQITDGEDTFQLLERLPGRNLGEARVNGTGWISVQQQMAEHIAKLHQCHSETYGDLTDGETHTRWLDWFTPRMRYNFEESRSHLSTAAHEVIEALLDHLDDWLPEANSPTLIHGDLWVNNIIVDDHDPDHPQLTGFIDPGGLFADVEYELAYLLVFDTADQHFFDAYTRVHPLREGFSRRCRVYWLNTQLMHCWLFGEEYLPRCEQLAIEIRQLT